MNKLLVLLLALSGMAFAQTKGQEIIDYKVPNSKAPEARTVINHGSGRVDTYQGTGRTETGAVTGTQAQRTHSVTAPSGETTYHRATGNQVITNSGAHVPRGSGSGLPASDLRGGGAAGGGGGGGSQAPLKK